MSSAEMYRDIIEGYKIAIKDKEFAIQFIKKRIKELEKEEAKYLKQKGMNEK